MKRLFLFVVLAVAGCTHDPDSYSIAPTDVQKYLLLSADSLSIPADGFSTVTIRATLDANADVTRREVRFVSSAGQLSGAGTPIAANAGAELKVTAVANASGELVAEVTLRSSTAIEVASVRASALQFTQEVRVGFTEPTTSDLLTMRVPARAPADGASLSELTLTIDPRLPTGRRTVKLTATKGRLVPEQVVFGVGENAASVFLESPADANPAVVTATIEGTASVRATIIFDPALPTSIVVTRDKVSISAAAKQTVGVEAVLLRSPGKVTAGTTVTFRAIADDGRGIGTFFNIRRSTAEGVATASWDPVDPTFLGRVRIVAEAGGLSGSTEVTVLP